jgi:spermidine dehydrogenase
MAEKDNDGKKQRGSTNPTPPSFGRREMLKRSAGGLLLATLPRCGSNLSNSPDATGGDFGNTTAPDAGADTVHVGSDSAPSTTPPPSCMKAGLETGIRGNTNASIEVAHKFRSGAFNTPPIPTPGAEESIYDLVVVGAGVAGIASAIYFLDAQPNARVLLLDNHDEFGGHARRNTFEVDGNTLIACGGTLEVESYSYSSTESRALFDRLGLNINTLQSYFDSSRYAQYDLTAGFLADQQSHQVDHAWAKRMWATEWPAFFSQLNLPPAVASDLAALCSVNTEPAGMNDVALASISMREYIEGRLGLSAEATRFADIFALDYFGVGCDTLTANAAMQYGPGFDWAGASWSPSADQAYDVMHTNRYPDGFHTIVRKMLALIKPEAFSRQGTLEDLFLADICPHKYDRPNDQVKLRLNSTAVHIAHNGAPATASDVDVYYLHNGQNRRAKARQVIMAGGSFMAKHILRDIPNETKAAANSMRYCPLVYTNVALHRWEAIAKSGIYWGCFLDSPYKIFKLQEPLSLPGYSPAWDPSQPITALMVWPAIDLNAKEDAQLSMGRMSMGMMDLAAHRKLVEETLTRLFGPYGFSPNDVAAITVNRWGHGYPLFDSVGSQSDPQQAAKGYGRISIAHVDNAGDVWAQGSIDAAYRAAQERLQAS